MMSSRYLAREVLFAPGRIVATPGALDLLSKNEVEPIDLVLRHLAGDFGDLDDEDRAANRDAIKYGSRVLSSYELERGKVWVITEWDRSATTLLLPSEY